MFQIAWETGYLATAAAGGVDLRSAERIVGTSAGSLVGAVLAARRIALLNLAADLMARATSVVSYLAPAGNLAPSQQRAFDLMWAATDNDPATVQAIGRAAMAASTPSARAMRRNIAVLVDYAWWPSRRLWVTAVDAYTAERVVVTKDAGVRTTRAVAASCALPGLYPPQQVGDRRCMDGAMSGTATNSDLVAGADRAVVLSLAPGDAPLPQAMAASSADHMLTEIESLRASGTQVLPQVGTHGSGDGHHGPGLDGRRVGGGSKSGQGRPRGAARLLGLIQVGAGRASGRSAGRSLTGSVAATPGHLPCPCAQTDAVRVLPATGRPRMGG